MNTDPVYDHAFDIAFSLKSYNDGHNVTPDELLRALKERVAHFEKNPQELIEACGMPFDTFTE